MKYKSIIILPVALAAAVISLWFMNGGFSQPAWFMYDDFPQPKMERVIDTVLIPTAEENPAPFPCMIMDKPSDRLDTADDSEYPPAAITENPDIAPAMEDEPISAALQIAPVEGLSCTLTVRCDTILHNMDRLNREKAELVPEDGVLFQTADVVFYDGESVFNLLQREMKRTKTHLAFRSTPVYKSAYIEAINNIYELDCGELSGWMYKVNGVFPSYGCSRYLLQEGDHVEWIYSCDLGRDIGGGHAARGQAE